MAIEINDGGLLQAMFWLLTTNPPADPPAVNARGKGIRSILLLGNVAICELGQPIAESEFHAHATCAQVPLIPAPAVPCVVWIDDTHFAVSLDGNDGEGPTLVEAALYVTVWKIGGGAGIIETVGEVG